MAPHDHRRVRTDLFLERLRQAFSHDLRTPLGSIVNYAATLEVMPPPSTETLRDVACRIRENAQRAARMGEILATAMRLAATRPTSALAPTDLAAVARAILSDGGARSPRVEVDRPRTVVCDAEVIAFAWRAFLAFERDAAAQPAVHFVIECFPTAERRDCIGLSPLGVGVTGAPRADLDAFVRQGGGKNRLETSLALRIACELLSLHAYEVELRGQPAHAAVLLITLPSAS